MTFWVPYLLSVLLAVATIVTNAIVNTKIKFAPDAAEAMTQLRQLGHGVLKKMWNIGLFAVQLWLLVNAVSSSEPLTRMEVLRIAMAVGGLLLLVIMWGTLYLVDRVTDVLITSMGRQLKIMGSIMEVMTPTKRE